MKVEFNILNVHMNILVTGGAGFIGSNAVKMALFQGHNVIVIDNLSRGDIRTLNKNTKFYNVDLRNKDELNAVFENEKIDVVMHFAAKIIVSESVLDPSLYYHNNVIGTINLLDSMRENGVFKIVFSSTAAVYGIPINDFELINEEFTTKPINPYGETKLVAENIIASYSKSYSIEYTIFRYFNVSGAVKKFFNPLNNTALIPRVINVANGIMECIEVLGKDYDTRDGTCIRDFIHMDDLLKAHFIAAEMMFNGEKINEVINLGSEVGYSVLDVINQTQKLIKRNIKIIYSERRAGDPVKSVADISKAKKVLNWVPEKKLKQIIIDSGLDLR